MFGWSMLRRLAGSSRRWALLGVVAGAAACSGSGAGGAGVVVLDSAGIRIVDNRAPDRSGSWSLVKVADLLPPDSALMAFPWGVSADPTTGRIYVADRFQPRVVVFDEAGAYQGSYGRAGEGPGEFSSPVALSVGPYGALTVWDAGRGVVSRWSSEGDLLNEQRAPVAHWGPGVYEVPGRLVTVTSETLGSEMRQALVELRGGDPVVLHTVRRELVVMELPCMTRPASRLFAPSVVWAAAGGTVNVLNGPDYRIDVYTDGVLASSIRRPVAPVPVTSRMAADRVRAEYAGLMRLCAVTAEQVVAAVGHEAVVPAVQWLTVDPAGRLWVSRSADGTEPSQVDVLSRDGRYEGTLEEAVLPVAFVSATRLVGLTVRAATGEVLLGLYDVRVREARLEGSAD
jgi:hypothetical protein